MRAITLWQPYAQLIAVGAKKFETRSWPTKYRGRIAIHAAKAVHYPSPEVKEIMKELGLKMSELDYGKVVCTANLVDCVEMGEVLIKGMNVLASQFKQARHELTCGGWSVGRYAWKLEDIKVLDTPLAIKGSQQMWTLRDDLIHEDYK